MTHRLGIAITPSWTVAVEFGDWGWSQGLFRACLVRDYCDGWGEALQLNVERWFRPEARFRPYLGLGAGALAVTPRYRRLTVSTYAGLAASVRVFTFRAEAVYQSQAIYDGYDPFLVARFALGLRYPP